MVIICLLLCDSFSALSATGAPRVLQCLHHFTSLPTAYKVSGHSVFLQAFVVSFVIY